MWRDSSKATGGQQTARNTSMVHLFGDERCTPAILEFLEFLATTEVGLTGGLQAGRAWEDTGGDSGDKDSGGTKYGDAISSEGGERRSAGGAGTSEVQGWSQGESAEYKPALFVLRGRMGSG
jgi:hypothetical protein